MDLSQLPTVNACLNSLSALLLGLGYVCIRRRAVRGHVVCMLSACVTSTLFLASYLYYHARHGSTHFQGTGLARPVYFTILVSHSLLAAVIVPMVIVTLYRGLTGQFARHVPAARKTLPLWMYVSITGVVIYWMLYHWPA